MKIKHRKSSRTGLKEYGYRFDYRDKTYRDWGFADAEDARVAGAARLLALKKSEYALLPNEELKKFTLKQAVDEYCDKLMGDAKQPREVAKMKSLTKKLRTFTTQVGEKHPLIGVTSKDLKIWRDAMLAEEIAASTTKVYMCWLRAAFVYAQMNHPELQQWQVPFFEYPQVEDNRREFVFEEHHLQSLKEYLLADRIDREWEHGPKRRRDLFDLLRLGLQTTMRINEMLALKWSDVDHKPGMLRVYSQKTNKTRYLVITPLMREMFEQRKLEARDEKVFDYDLNLHYNSLLGLLKRACKACGIPYGYKGATFHTTRHTAISRMAEKGVNITSIMTVAGHSQISNTQRYLHGTKRTISEAMAKLAAFDDRERERSREERLLDLMSVEDRKLWALMSDETRRNLAGILPENGGKLVIEGNASAGFV